MFKEIEAVTTTIELERDIGRGFKMKDLGVTKAIDRVMNYCVAQGHYDNDASNHVINANVGILNFIKHAIISDKDIDHMFEIVTILDVFGAMFGRGRTVYTVCKNLADKLHKESSVNHYIDMSIFDLFNTNSKLLHDNYHESQCLIISIYDNKETFDRYLTLFTTDRVVTHCKGEEVDWMGRKFSNCHKDNFKLVSNTIIVCPVRAMLNAITKGDE